MKIIGQTQQIFPTNIYIGEITQEVHDKTLTKLADIQWGTVPLSNKAHGMNISKKEGKPSFQADVISEFELNELHDELGHHIRAYCDDMNVPMNINSRDSWITQYHKGDFAVQHSHGSASISIAYYIASNGKDGNFYFANHTPARFALLTDCLPNLFSIPPKERKLLMFPSWMEHGVEQNQTDNVRRCLSANFYSQYG